ncbi:MAG: mechanosensitive ion channel family protein [Sphingomonadaceae bacterium]|jgi:small-conductance mechanosensitive channel|nr:mechanosensitive ion channel family protein [Sphingomonadaceae bacterium]
MQTPPSFVVIEINSWAELALRWLDSHTSQILSGALTAALIILLLHGLKLAGRYLCADRFKSSHWPGIIGRALGKTRLWFMSAVALEVVAKAGKAPVEVAAPIYALFVIACVLQAAVWVRALILGLVEFRAGENDSTGNLQSAIGLIRVLVTAGLFILAAIVILSNLGVNVTGLVAGLGIGGIAIGLAAQGIFSDLFAALSVLFDKPFRKGDMVKFDQSQGTVEAIGLKSTRIRAISGEEIVISNANLLNKELRNLAQQETRRYFQTLSLVHQTPPDVCQSLPDLLRDVVDSVEGATFSRCGLDNFAPSSLDFLLIYEIAGDDPGEAMDRKHKVNTRILAALKDRGIAFAYPTQTTFTAAPDGQMIMPYFIPDAEGRAKR